MEIRLFDLERDEGKIESFLDAASLAHKNERKTKDWFLWKFFGSPYGRATIVCAFDGARVAGCVAYGPTPVRYNGREYKGALAYENFVHPDYQGKGLFKRLIGKLLAVVGEKQLFDLLWVYPNKNAIRGYLRMNWTEVAMPQYRIKLVRPFRVMMNFNNLRSPFVPMPSNLDSLLKDGQAAMDEQRVEGRDIVFPLWRNKYMDWRFRTFPVSRYYIEDCDEFFACARIGFRKAIKEAQILVVQSRATHEMSVCLKTFLVSLSKTESPDIIGVSTTPSHPLTTCLSGFFKVPSAGHFCYFVPKTSVLYGNSSFHGNEWALSMIDYHTY